MSSIDNTIVSMEFDNKDFERRLSETLASLDKLSESLRFAGAENGFRNVADAANSFDTSRMADSLDKISSKFTAIGVIGFEVIRNLTASVIDFAKQTAGDILDPIVGGGKRRAENIEQAKFQFRGLGIDVEQAMNSALIAVKGTAYGLDEAAKVAAQFGASGIDAGDQMTRALRGIAGAAAMTGTSFREIGDIFTSSAGTGVVNSQDLQQFATRGLNAAAALGKVLGKTEAQVREMASSGQLDFKTFADAMDQAFGEHATKANETYSGSLANLRAAMSRLGASFFGPQQEQQRDLFNALTPVIDKVASALKPLIGVFIDVRRLGVEQLISLLNGLDLSFFTWSIPIFSKVFLNVMQAVGQFINIIKSAFREIFPPRTTSIFIDMAEALRDFSERLKMGGETADKVKSVFKGIFSILSIGWEVVKGIASVFLDLFTTLAGAAGVGSGGILSFFANIGEALVSFKEALVDGGGISAFFEKISNAIKDPMERISAFRDRFLEFVDQVKSAILGLFGGKGSSVDIPGAEAVGNVVDRMTHRFDQLKRAAELLGKGWEAVKDVLGAVWGHLSTWLSELGGKLAAVMKPGDFDAAVDAVNVGLLGGIIIMFKKFLSGGLDINLMGGLVEKIGEAFDGLTGALDGMQTKLKAEALMKLAIAIGVLTASIVVLSLIDSAALTKALTAIAVGFAQLIGAMALMDKVGVGAAKFGVMAAGLILLSTAIGVLSISVKILSTMSWAELSRGLAAVTALLVGLTASTRLIAADVSGMIRAGVAMTAISIALLLLSQAVKAFASMSWEDMAKGLIGVGTGLGLITLAMNFMPASSMIAAGIAMIPLATGLSILAGAVKLFSMLSWGEMLKGMTGIGAGLVIIALAMNMMPITLPVTAAGLVLVAAALNIMAGAIILMGSQDLGSLAKGVGALGVMLGILAVAMIAMSGTLTGAAALVVVSTALLILSKVIIALSGLSIGELAMALGAIAAVLLALGLAALVLQPVIPSLFALGGALALIGAGFALFGFGASKVAEAFETLGKSGKAGIEALIELFKRLMSLMPELVSHAAKAIVELAKTVLDGLPVLIKGLTVVLLHILDTVIELVPEIVEALGVILTGFLELVTGKIPEVVETGFAILMAFLDGIRDNIEEIVTVVSEIVIGIIDAFAEKVPELVDSLFNLFLEVITSVAFQLGENSTAFIPVGQALIDGFITGLTTNLANLLNFFIELPGKILGIIKEAFGINSPSTVFSALGGDLIVGFLNGLIQTIPKVMTWFIELPGKVLGWIGSLVATLVPKGIELIVGLLKGITDKVVEVAAWYGGLPIKILGWIGSLVGTLVPKGIELIAGLLNGLISKAVDIFNWFTALPGQILSWVGNFGSLLLEPGKDLIRGLWGGINAMKDWVMDKVKGFAGSVVDGIKGFFGIGSPSKVFRAIGSNLGESLGMGLKEMAHSASLAALKVGNKVQEGWDRANVSLTLADIEIGDINPVIAPVLDLSQVREESKRIGALMAVSPITPDVSFQRAHTIATTAEMAKTEDTPAPTGPTEITFEQNIYAPTALSTNDIYRNTKSQIALAKEELNIA